MGWMFQAVIQDSGLHRFFQPVGVRAFGAGETIQQPLGSKGLEVAADLIKWLSGVSHNLASLGNVILFQYEMSLNSSSRLAEINW